MSTDPPQNVVPVEVEVVNLEDAAPRDGQCCLSRLPIRARWPVLVGDRKCVSLLPSSFCPRLIDYDILYSAPMFLLKYTPAQCNATKP